MFKVFLLNYKLTIHQCSVMVQKEKKKLSVTAQDELLSIIF